MRSGPASSPSGPRLWLRGAAGAVRAAARGSGRRARRSAIAAPLDTAGFLGAAATAWISTSPSLLPRTWWMWAVNIGLSEVYGYASGALAGRAVRRMGREIGLQVSIAPDHRLRARWIGAGARVGIPTYPWARGLLRPYLPRRVVKVLSLLLTAATVAVVADRLIRGRVLEAMIERADTANQLISPDVPRPTSALRSGGPQSLETWQSLGAPGRKIV